MNAIENNNENVIKYTNTREKFLDSIRVKIQPKNRVETLICEGDGLGIQNSIK